MHSINEIISRFKQKYGKYETVPQSKADILEYQRLITRLNPSKNYKLPADYVKFMLEVGPFKVDDNLTFESIASIKKVIYAYNTWMNLVLSNEFYEDEDKIENPGRINNDEEIQYRWFDEGWIPICDDNGDCICIDLNPSPLGKVGQIIQTYHDYNKRIVIANSFSEFISSIKYEKIINIFIQNRDLTESSANKPLIESDENYDISASKEEITKAINALKNKKAPGSTKNIAEKFLKTLQRANINKNAFAGAGGYVLAYSICKSKGLPVSKINIFKNFKIFLTINPFKGFGNFIVFASAFICLYNVVKSGKKLMNVLKDTPPSTISYSKSIADKIMRSISQFNLSPEDKKEVNFKIDSEREEIIKNSKNLNKKLEEDHQNKMDAIEVNYDVSKKYLKELEDAYNSKDAKKIQQIAKVANDDKRLDDNTRPNINTHVKLWLGLLSDEKKKNTKK